MGMEPVSQVEIIMRRKMMMVRMTRLMVRMTRMMVMRNMARMRRRMTVGRGWDLTGGDDEMDTAKRI